MIPLSLLFAAIAWRACAANSIAAPHDVAPANGTAAAAAPGGTVPAESPPVVVVYNSGAVDDDDNAGAEEDENRDSRFLSFGAVPDPSAAANSLQEKQDVAAGGDPSAHLVDIYTDCLMQLSFPCVQRKLLLFLDKLGRMKGKPARTPVRSPRLWPCYGFQPSVLEHSRFGTVLCD